MQAILSFHKNKARYVDKSGEKMFLNVYRTVTTQSLFPERKITSRDFENQQEKIFNLAEKLNKKSGTLCYAKV